MVQADQGHPLEPRSTIGLDCISHNNRRTAKLKIPTLCLSMGIVCDLACVHVKYLSNNTNTNMGIRCVHVKYLSNNTNTTLASGIKTYPGVQHDNQKKTWPGSTCILFKTNKINKSVPTYITPELKNSNHVCNLSNFLFRLWDNSHYILICRIINLVHWEKHPNQAWKTRAEGLDCNGRQ
jgi:hypothetical protein